MTTKDNELLRAVIQSVSIEYGTNLNELASPSRNRNISDARHICMAVLVNFSSLSLELIAGLFNRDHSSVNAGCKMIFELVPVNNEIRKKVLAVLWIVNSETGENFKLSDLKQNRTAAAKEDGKLFKLMNELEKLKEQITNKYSNFETLKKVARMRELKIAIQVRKYELHIGREANESELNLINN